MPLVQATESLRFQVERFFEPLSAEGSLPFPWRLRATETEQGISLVFAAGESWLQVELELADPARPCYARTRRFNVYYNLHSGGSARTDARLPEGARTVLGAVVSLLRSREGELPSPHVADAPSRVVVRELEVNRALVEDGPHRYYVNPYVGCMIGCEFCYARHRTDLSRSLEGLPRSSWGRWVDVKLNLAAVLREEVQRLPPGSVRLSPIITDPYQPIETRYRITRRVLEVLQPTQFRPVVLTRGSLILDDLELLQRCHDAVVGVSITTDDDHVRQAFEPRAESIDTRLRTLRALSEAGLCTYAVIQPMLPLDPERLVDLVAPWVRHVRIGPIVEPTRFKAGFARLGIVGHATDWEEQTYARLREGFEAAGVHVNRQDELGALF